MVALKTIYNTFTLYGQNNIDYYISLVLILTRWGIIPRLLPLKCC